MQIAYDEIVGPLGAFDISTIQTYAGGAPDTIALGGFIKASDFESYCLWPFETMVFRKGSSAGVYHAPLASREEALKHHALMVATIKSGAEFGGGVDEHGNPDTTREQWEARCANA